MSNVEWLKHKKMSYGGYHGQAVELRKFAIEKWGVDAVASMTDQQIEREMQNAGFIPCLIHSYDRDDDETIFLVPYEVLEAAKQLNR